MCFSLPAVASRLAASSGYVAPAAPWSRLTPPVNAATSLPGRTALPRYLPITLVNFVLPIIYFAMSGHICPNAL